MTGRHVPVVATVIVALVALDGFRRRGVGTSALPPLLIDMTAVGVGLLLWGSSPGTQVAALAYFLVATSLLVTGGAALGVLVYAVSWTVVDGLVVGRHGLLGIPGFVAETRGFDVVVAMFYLVLMGVVLYGAVHSLLRAQDRQERALAAERRAVELKNEFVSMVSHELRTPLTGIAGFTDTLREAWRVLPPEEVDEFLSIMRRETEHLSNLVEDILVIPRLEANQLRLDPEPVNVAEVGREVCEAVLRGTKEFSIEVSSDAMVEADPVRLRQVLRNLIENARKYGGDQILIEGGPTAGGMFTVTVNDNGPGIPEGDEERIFEHFEQLSKGDARLQQGVGLGLPIARKLVRAMGGDLWYEQRFPVGARFCFTVPVAAAAAGETAFEQDLGAIAS